MSPNSGSPDSGKEKPGPLDVGQNTKRDAIPDAKKMSRLLANCQPLIDRLYAEAIPCSWSISRDRFEASLERSAAKRFASKSFSPEEIEEYLGALHLQDLSLAAACAEGHPEAWEYFVATYRTYLRSAAAAILRCPASSPAAHDLADSLFAELYGLTDAKRGDRSLFRYFHGRSSLKTWLRAVLGQRNIDAIRAGKKFDSLDEGAEDGETRRVRELSTVEIPADPHREPYLQKFREALTSALESLETRDRERLRLYYAEDRTLAEIGRELG